MRFIREDDNHRYILAKNQAWIFSSSAKDGLPSYYFIRLFMFSNEATQFDDLSFLSGGNSQESVYEAVKGRLKAKQGQVFSESEMSWIGYFYRSASYLTGLDSKTLVKKVSPMYLRNVYYPYHSLDIVKAIQLVMDSLCVDKEEDINTKLLNLLRTEQK